MISEVFSALHILSLNVYFLVSVGSSKNENCLKRRKKDKSLILFLDLLTISSLLWFGYRILAIRLYRMALRLLETKQLIKQCSIGGLGMVGVLCPHHPLKS